MKSYTLTFRHPKSPARYMAKYLSKEGSRIGGNFYDMSKGIRSLIKPTKEYTTEVRGPEYPIIKDCQEALNNSQLDYFELKSSDEINMSNFSFYADQLDEGMKFQFGFFIPPQESSIDLISLLMQAIYPSMKNKISPNWTSLPVNVLKYLKNWCTNTIYNYKLTIFEA